MDPDPDLGMADAAREMANGSSLLEILERAVQTCVEVIGRCHMAGISVAKSGRVRTLAASSDQLRIIDDLQFQLREGPCFDVLRRESPVTAHDLATDERWPRWGPLVSERTGVHGSMSHRLFTQGDALGALNIYSTEPGGFEQKDLVQGYVLAAHAAVAVANNRQVRELNQALASRTVIGQATGIMMERFGLDPNAAFGVLSRLSQTNNVKIATLANDLVQHGWLPPIDRPQPPD
jgi:GAF domain-containing protein